MTMKQLIVLTGLVAIGIVVARAVAPDVARYLRISRM